MPIPNKILVAAWSKSDEPKYDYYLSQFVSKYKTQFDITYLDDTTGPIYRQTLQNIDPIFLVHSGHGQPQSWVGLEDPDPWTEILLHIGEHKPLIVGRVGTSIACFTGQPDGMGEHWPQEDWPTPGSGKGIAYNGYDGFGQSLDPFWEDMTPYKDDWYWVACGTQDFFCQGYTLSQSVSLKINKINELINKWSIERPNELWELVVGMAENMIDITRVFGDATIKLDGTYEEPPCKDYTSPLACLAAGCFWYDNRCWEPICGWIKNQFDCENMGCYWWDDTQDCHASPPEQCSDYTSIGDCLAANCFWYNNSCHGTLPVCESLTNEEDCTRNDCWWYNESCHTYRCEDYTSPLSCSAAGCYWYDGACHSTQGPVIYEFLPCDATDYEHCWDYGDEGSCEGDPLCDWQSHWPGCSGKTQWDWHPPAKSTFQYGEIVWIYGRFDCVSPCPGWSNRYVKYELWKEGGTTPERTITWGPLGDYTSYSFVWWLYNWSAGNYRIQAYWGDTSSCPDYLGSMTFTILAPPCEEITTTELCIAAKCYWWDGACHSEPEPGDVIGKIDFVDSVFYSGPFEPGTVKNVSHLKILNIGPRDGVVHWRLYEFPGLPTQRELQGEDPVVGGESWYWKWIEEEIPITPGDWPLGIKVWGEDETKPSWGTLGTFIFNIKS